jgi:hypothetical protein
MFTQSIPLTKEVCHSHTSFVKENHVLSEQAEEKAK